MAAIWGDGFAGDGFPAVCSMTEWDGCSPDEYAILFPRLLPTDGRLPAPLRRHLEACVAWRASRLAPALPGFAIRSRVPAAVDGPRDGSADDGAVTWLLRRMGMLRTSPERVAAERRLLALLDALLDDVQRGVAPAWSEDREAWFAFGSGIHPAYLWAESAGSPDRGCAAAWLGHLDRGRTALMPPAVADYLTDAVLHPSHPRDRVLAAMVGASGDARRLRRAAALRLAGRDPAVAFGRGRGSAFRPFRPTAVIRGGALERV